MATDFSSLDKLVEFGLGVSIATQMMNTMNHTLAQTAVPGVGINPGVSPSPQQKSAQSAAPAPAMKQFFIVKDEKLAGPLTEQEISELVKKGVITDKTFCWYTGLDAWKLAEDIPEINKLFLLNS